MVNLSVFYRLGWCWNLSKEFRWPLVVYYISELFVIACSLTFVVFSKNAIDYAVSGDKILMVNSVYWMVALIASSIFFKTVGIKYNELSKIKMLRNLQNEIVEVQMYSSWKHISRWNTGDIQLRVQKDCTEIVQMITQAFPNFTLTIIRLLASVSLLWIMDSRLALIILVITPLFLFSKVYYKKFRKLNKDLKYSESDLGHVVNENLKFRMLIRSLGIEQERSNKLNSVQQRIMDLKIDILNFSLISQTIVKLTFNTGFLVAFIWSVLGLYAGNISFGTMSAFLQLVGRVQSPMLGLLSFFPSVVSFGVSVDRVQELLESNSEAILEPRIIKNLEKIEISNLSFRYDDKEVFENLNLTLVKGESTAVLGASGRGKTTLIRLLLSILKPDKGEILLYFNNKVDYLSSIYRCNIGFVPQGDKLFSTTIRENLLLGSDSISEKSLQEAIYNACAEFIYDLPQGIDTVVGEAGFGLSEGQAQRIAIARTILKDTSIWLFDEITSSLDSETAELLIKRLHSIGGDKVIMFVTHDFRLAERCKQVYYMK